MSVEAERVYQEKTKVQQEVMGEIDALKRAITRNQRMVVGLDRRIASADADLAQGLKQERTRVAVQIQAQGAELDARNAEYLDLPQTPLEFMPVSIEVAVTETESEKGAQLALADLVGTTGNLVASAVGNATSGLISRSVNPADIKTEPDAADLAGELQSARARYFDALVAARTNPSGKVGEDAQRSLAAAKEKIDEAKHSLGLEVNTMVHGGCFLRTLGGLSGLLAIAWLPMRSFGADPVQQDASQAVLSDQQIEQALRQPKTRGFTPRGLTRRDTVEPDQSVYLNIPFEYNSSALKPQASAQLRQLELALTSATLGKDRFVVAGHTDAKGSPQYNKRLSLRRAEAVKRFLVATASRQADWTPSDTAPSICWRPIYPTIRAIAGSKSATWGSRLNRKPGPATSSGQRLIARLMAKRQQ